MEAKDFPPNNWHIDNYGDKLEQSHGYVQKLRKCKQAIPTQHEPIESYIIRLRQTLEDNGHVSELGHISPKMWYTHKMPQNCWICDSHSIAQTSLDVLEQIIEAMPKSKKLKFEQYKNTGLKLQ